MIMKNEVRAAIVVAPYYESIVYDLYMAATATLEKNTELECLIERHDVPGALEIPLACQWLAQTGRADLIVALGTVVRGETAHFDHVCQQSARGLMDVSLRHNVPIGNGILTVETLEQALARSAQNDKNKGAEAARAALSLYALKQRLHS